MFWLHLGPIQPCIQWVLGIEQPLTNPVYVLSFILLPFQSNAQYDKILGTKQGIKNEGYVSTV